MALTTRIIKVFNNLGQNIRPSKVVNENYATVNKAQKIDLSFKDFFNPDIVEVGADVSEEVVDGFFNEEEKKQINYFA